MTRLFALAALTTTLLACSPGDRFFDDVAWEDGAGWNFEENSNVTGRMVGEMPEVGAFENNDGYGSAYISPDWMDVQLHTKGDYGWAMVGISAMVDTASGEIIEDGSSVIGCSGPEEGWADFDEPATNAEITVDIIEIDGVEFQEIEVVAEFNRAGTVIGVAQVPVGE